MKKLIAAAALASALLTGAVSAHALDRVYLNDNDTYALRTVSGEPMIAVRAFFEGAGYTVQWNSDLSCAVVFDSDLNIGLYEGQSYIYLNGHGQGLSSEVSIDNGTLVMPIDAAVKALDASLVYLNDSAYLTSTEVNDCSTWQLEVLTLTNAERKKRGLAPLIWNPDLAKVAEAHCRDMSDRGYFSHETPEGLAPLDRAASAGISFRAIAENIAAGQPDPEAVMECWINSPKHLENIMDPDLTELGVAFVRGGRYGIYWAQDFITK